MKVFHMLSEVVWAEKCAFFFWFGHAFLYAVGVVEVLFAGVLEHAECAGWRGWFGARRMWNGKKRSSVKTCPFSFWAVLSLFVPTPGLWSYALVAKGALPHVWGSVILHDCF